MASQIPYNRRLRRQKWIVLGLSALAFAGAQAYNYFARGIPLGECAAGWLLGVACALLLIEIVFHVMGRWQRQMEKEILAHTQLGSVLERAKREWETTFDAMIDWVCLLQLDHSILRSNRAGEGLTGLPVREIVGKKCFSVVHGTDAPIPDCPLPRMLQSGKRESIEFFSEPLNRWLLITVDPVRDESGNLVSAVHIVRDITERVHIQEALRASEAKHRVLVEQSLQGQVVVQDWRIVFANPAFSEISGYSAGELLSMPSDEVQALVHPEDQEMVWGRLRDRLAGEPAEARYAYRGICKNGEVRWLEMSATRIEYGGKPAVQAVIVDITERRRAEDERERLIGELQEALARVKLLSGMLPICASCKKIRDDQGYWHQVEEYVRDHSEAEFSHSICPECARRLYPDYVDEDEDV